MPLQDPDRIIYSIQEYGFPAASCHEIYDFVYTLQRGEDLCINAQSIRYLCGCNDDSRNYLGAKTLKQKKWLVWTPRITGFMSLLGSAWIISDVVRHYRRRRFTLFHELISAISICDIVSSIGWMLSTAPIPQTNKYGESTGVVGASGTEATCTLQGFMIQFGLGGVFYQVSLSLYYLLVIRQSWPEQRLRQVPKWFHIPMVLGIALALAAIPHYDNDLFGCYLPPPPLVTSHLNVILFNLLPISIAVVITSVNMLLIYARVSKQTRAGDRWRIPSHEEIRLSTPSGSKKSSSKFWKRPFFGRSETSSEDGSSDGVEQPRVCPRRSSVQSQVFWQCALYLGSFYLCWSLLFASHIVGAGVHYFYWLALLTLAAVQGFVNFLVYIRPRLIAAWQRRQREKKRKEKSNNNNSICNSSPPTTLPSTFHTIEPPSAAEQNKE